MNRATFINFKRTNVWKFEFLPKNFKAKNPDARRRRMFLANKGKTVKGKMLRNIFERKTILFNPIISNPLTKNDTKKEKVK